VVRLRAFYNAQRGVGVRLLPYR